MALPTIGELLPWPGQWILIQRQRNFFINVADNDFLNFRSETPDGFGYCVFGRVFDGMDVVDAIKAVSTTSRGGHSDVPVDDVIIQKASVI